MQSRVPLLFNSTMVIFFNVTSRRTTLKLHEVAGWLDTSSRKQTQYALHGYLHRQWMEFFLGFPSVDCLLAGCSLYPAAFKVAVFSTICHILFISVLYIFCIFRRQGELCPKMFLNLVPLPQGLSEDRRVIKGLNCNLRITMRSEQVWCVWFSVKGDLWMNKR